MQAQSPDKLIRNTKCIWPEVTTRRKAAANQMIATNPIAYRFGGGFGPGSRTGAGGSVCGFAGGSLIGIGGESGGPGATSEDLDIATLIS